MKENIAEGEQTDVKNVTRAVLDACGGTSHCAIIATLAIYVIGAVVLNTHLANINIVDQSVASIAFIYSAANYIFFLCFFCMLYISVHIFECAIFDERLCRTRGLHQIFLFICAAIKLMLLCCFFTSWYVSLCIGDESGSAYKIAVYLALFLVALEYYLKRKNVAGLLPAVVFLLMTAATCVAFYYLSKMKVYMATFLIFLTMYCVSFCAHITLKTHKQMLNNIFTALCVAMYIFSSATLFGMYIYKDIPARLGGGASYRASISIYADKISSYPRAIFSEATGRVECNMLYSNEKYQYISVEDCAYRINSSDISAVAVRSLGKKSAFFFGYELPF